MEKSRGIGFSSVFFLCFSSAETSHETFRRHLKPLPPPVSSIQTHTFLCCSSIPPSISLSYYHSLPLSSRSGTTSSLVEFQTFSLRFFFLFLDFFFIFLFVLSVFLFVRSSPYPHLYKDLKAKRNELKDPPPQPLPVLKNDFSQMNIHLGSDG